MTDHEHTFFFDTPEDAERAAQGAASILHNADLSHIPDDGPGFADYIEARTCAMAEALGTDKPEMTWADVIRRTLMGEGE